MLKDIQWKESILLIFFYSIIALSLLAPIASDANIPSLGDFINHLSSVIQARLSIEEGQFPLRVAPFHLNGFRYPIYQFYSPTLYFFTGLIYKLITPDNPLSAIKITFCLSLTLGGFYTQRLVFWFTGSRIAALLASVVFLFSPYLITAINHFGDLTETVALSLMPVSLFYALKLYVYPQKPLTVLFLSILNFLILTTHTVTFFYYFIFIIPLLFFITLRYPKRWRNFLYVLFTYCFSFLLAAWYIAPIGILKNYLVVAETFSNAEMFTSTNIVLSYLLSPASMSFQRELTGNHIAIGWIMLLAFAIGSYTYLMGYRIKHKRGNLWLPYLLILFGILIMLIWTPLNFWKWMPKFLLVGQYSWRILGQTLWIGAVLFAFSFLWLFENKLDKRHFILGLLLIVLTTSMWFPTTSVYPVNLAEFIKKPLFAFNGNDYLLDYERYPNLVQNIDRLSLKTLIVDRKLIVDKDYVVTKELLAFTHNPTLYLEGDIESSLKPHESMTLLINDKIIEEKPLKPGLLKWEIPLESFKHNLKEGDNFKIKFKASSQSIPLNLVDVVIKGFINPAEILGVKMVKSHCKQKGDTGLCELNVPPTVKKIELPIFYYPDMLKITLNGKNIPYQNILAGNYLIALIDALPGQKNIIKFRFEGIAWANWVSVLAFSLWLMILFRVLFTGLRR